MILLSFYVEVANVEVNSFFVFIVSGVLNQIFVKLPRRLYIPSPLKRLVYLQSVVEFSHETSNINKIFLKIFWDPQV